MRLKSFSLPDWNMASGESKTRTLILRDEVTGDPYDFVDGASAKFMVFDFVNYNADSLFEPKSINITIEDGYNCKCVLPLAPEDTEGVWGKFIYQVTIDDGHGNISKPRGILNISMAKSSQT